MFPVRWSWLDRSRADTRWILRAWCLIKLHRRSCKLQEAERIRITQRDICIPDSIIASINLLKIDNPFACLPTDCNVLRLCYTQGKWSGDDNLSFVRVYGPIVLLSRSCQNLSLCCSCVGFLYNSCYCYCCTAVQSPFSPSRLNIIRKSSILLRVGVERSV